MPSFLTGTYTPLPTPPSVPSSNVMNLSTPKRIHSMLNSSLRFGALLAYASIGIAHAATYSYTPTNTATDVWSAGTDWDVTPVSDPDATLVFGPAANFTDLTPIANTNTNDIGTFSLNVLTLQGIGEVTAGNAVSVLIAGGTLNFVNSSGAIAPVINLNATNAGSTVSYNITSAITLGNALTITGTGNSTFALSGAISGANGITKSGSSVLTLAGTNSYTGNTAINGGTIKINAANNLGDETQATNTISFTGGTLESTGNSYDLGVNRAITLNGAGIIQADTAATTLTISGAITNGANTLTVTGAGNTTISGVIGSGGGGITKNGAGILTLSGNNGYTGTVALNAGTIVAGSPNALGTAAVPLTIAGGTTLTLASDTSTNAHPITLTGSAIIESSKATAASPGITQTLGTLSIPNVVLTANAGANVSGGAPVVAFGATTVTTTGATFTANTASLSLASVTGTNTAITLGGSATGSTVGAITTGTGTVTKTGTGKWTLSGNGTYSGTTTVSQGILEIGSDSTPTSGTLTSGPIGTGILSLSGGSVQATSGTPRAIGNTVYLSASSTITGDTAINFGGQLSSRTSGTTLTVNNTGLTTFSGGIGIRGDSVGNNRTMTVAGSGPILVSGAVTDGIAGATANNINYSGTGTLTLAGANTYTGSSAFTGTGVTTPGTVVFDGTSGGSMTGITAITVGAAAVSGNLKIKGNYSLGLGGTNKNLSIRGGDGVTTGQGTLSLQDGTKNTLTITPTNTSGQNTLILNAGAVGSNLSMDVGGGGADAIVLAGATTTAGRYQVATAGNVNLNLNGIGNVVAGTFQLISGPNNLSGAATYTVNTTGNFNGYTSAVASPTASGLQLVVSNLAAAPATAYWAGDVSASWNAFTGGIANNTNWATDVGGTNSMQVPDSTSDVIFSVTSPSNTATTLGQAFSVKSLTFSSGTASIAAGANALTIGAGGLTASGTATGTIGAPVTISSSQTWTNNSSNDLTVSGAVTTSTGITKAGTGALVLGGNNPAFTGGLTINDGAVRVGNAGALNSSTPQAVTFGASAPSTAKFQTNGNSITIGALSTNATPGTPIIENANATPTTLTVSQSSNTTYAGTIQNGTGGGALGFVKSGSGTLSLAGNNSYTGTTSVNGGALLINGNSAAANGAVTVNTATLGGTGTIGGAVSVNGTGRVTGGDIGTTGTLSLANGLSIASGGVAYFDINDNSTHDSIAVTGNLSLSTGTIIKVPASLTTTIFYDLITYTGSGPADLSGVTFQSFAGGSLPGTYGFSIVGSNTIRLTISGATTAIPTINITSPAPGLRVMSGTSVSIAGDFGNTGVVDLHGTLADNSGQLTLSNFSPSGSTTVVPNGSHAYTADIADTGATLGSRTYSIKVSDPAASPTSTSAASTLDVLGNRTVNASTVVYGNVHVNAAAPGNTSLTSSQPDDQYTSVTVANGTNGTVTVSGGNTATVFNGTNSDSRSVAGVFTALGAQNGTVTLVTTGEGLAGESPINVGVNYNATVFSGTAAWAANSSGSWVTQANWGDTNAGNLGGAGAPGLDGAASIGDTATFGDVAGLGSTATVSLNGVNPTLAGITFNSTATAYTVATGSGGSITLQGAATPVSVTGNHAISAVLTGSGGLSKSGTGTLTLSAANTYTGATAISNGIVQLTTGADRLPTGTTLTLGGSSNSGKLILGAGATAANQTLAGLLTSGSGGASNRVVGGASSISTLTVNVASGTNTFDGTLGGGGTNESSLALTKIGAGDLILSNSPNYTGTTTITQGLLQTPTGADLAGFVTFGGTTLPTAGVWQTSGTITKTLSTTSASGNLNWVSFNGFAAKGGTLNLALSNAAPLTWGANGFMGSGGAAMIFGSPSADGQVILPNAINLASTDDFQRPIYVAQGLGGDSAKLSGVLSSGTGTTGISKQGPGTLILSGVNTYTGTTNVTAGTLKIESPTALGYGLGTLPVSFVSGSATPGMTVLSAGATVDLNGQTGIREPFSVTGTGVGGLGALVNTNTGATATIDPGLTSLGIANQGAGYTTATVTISGGGFTGTTQATATATIGTVAPNVGKIISLTLTSLGDGIYTSAPTVTITGDGTGATANGVVSSIVMGGVGSIGGAGNITVNAPVTGANALTKVGTGTVTLAGVNTYTGGTTVSAGSLVAETPSALGNGAITLSGGNLTLGAATTLTLNATSLTWNSGGVLKFNLDVANASDTLALSGAFTQGTGSSFVFDFGNTGQANSVYTLASFSSTNFPNASGFGFLNLAPGITGHFELSGTTLNFVSVPEPGTVFVGLAMVGLVAFRLRKRLCRHA